MELGKIKIQVSRQVLDDTSLDLTRFLDAVYEAVLENYQLFWADNKFDLYPEEVNLDSVVVYNTADRQYVRAMIEVGQGGQITFNEVEFVKKQWVPVGTVERSKERDFYTIEVPQRNSMWGHVLGC